MQLEAIYAAVWQWLTAIKKTLFHRDLHLAKNLCILECLKLHRASSKVDR